MATTLEEMKASSIPTWEKGSQDEFERWRILNVMRMTEKEWHESLENDWGEASTTATPEQKKKDLQAHCFMLTKNQGNRVQDYQEHQKRKSNDEEAQR